MFYAIINFEINWIYTGFSLYWYHLYFEILIILSDFFVINSSIIKTFEEQSYWRWTTLITTKGTKTTTKMPRLKIWLELKGIGRQMASPAIPRSLRRPSRLRARWPLRTKLILTLARTGLLWLIIEICVVPLRWCQQVATQQWARQLKTSGQLGHQLFSMTPVPRWCKAPVSRMR